MFTVRKRHLGITLLLLCLCVGAFALGEGVSPTTGMPYPEGRGSDYRPVLINVSNSEESRPQLGMSLADVVYEYVYWGPGHTRYLALYNDVHPEKVGSVRSSKALGMSLRNGWDCPIVFQGGDTSDTSDSAYGFINAHQIPQSMLFDGVNDDGSDTRVIDILTRATDREAPHNVVANLQLLVEKHWPGGAGAAGHSPQMPPFQFGVPTEGDGAAAEVIVPYDQNDYIASYVYDAAEGHYKRSYNSKAHIDGLTGQQFVASNVIVQYASLTFPDNIASQPVWGITGEGKIDVFIGGQHIAGTWNRSDHNGAFAYFDLDGNPLVLSPGQTFIQIVPIDMQITIK